MNKSEFDGHGVWTALQNSVELLGRIEAESGEEGREDRQRIRWIASHTLRYRKSDWRMFAPSMLQSASAEWSQVQSYLEQVEAGTTTSLASALQSAESSLVTVAPWPAPSARSGGEGKAEKAFFDNYDEAVGQAMESLHKRIKELTTESEARNTAHAESVASLEQEIASLTATVEQQATKITTASETLDQKIASVETDAAEAQTTRGEKFAEWIEERERVWVEEKSQPIVDKLEAKDQAAQKRLDELEALGTQIEKVAGKTASAVLARDYGRYSLREWVTGLIAYALGIILLVSVGIYLLHTVGQVDRDAEISWQYIALKLGLTVTVVAASTVLFQLGRQSLRQASSNKKIELELRAIVPFLADVDDEEATKKAKIAFIERSFGRPAEGVRQHDENLVNVSVVERLINLATRGSS